MQDNTIWTSILDGRYTVTVMRVSHYHGELSIAEGDQVLHREPVGLMYDARFGPDVADVIEWKRIAIDFAGGRNSLPD